MVAAELAAWVIIGADAAASQRARARRVEPVELLGGERVVGLVGHGAVGPDAFELAARRARPSARPAPTTSSGARPDPVHAGVDLEVHRATRSGAAAAATTSTAVVGVDA